jgi:RimJ/RimL family protein N-acetyltransferase
MGLYSRLVASPNPTARLSFHEMTHENLDEIASLLGDPEVMAYYERPKTRDEALAWIEWNQRLYAERGHGLWLLRLRETGTFVGECGLTPQAVDDELSIEVGYHLVPAMQGHGFAVEAASACRAYAADTLGLDRLIAIISPLNEPSQRVAERIGLVYERHTQTKSGRPCVVLSCNPAEVAV